jgi:hypothetical protein
MSRAIIEISGMKLKILKVLWNQQLNRRDGKFTYPYISVGKISELLGNPQVDLDFMEIWNELNKIIVQLEELGGLELVEGIKIKDDEYYKEDPKDWMLDLEEFYSKFEATEKECFEETQMFKLSPKGIYYCETVLDLTKLHEDITLDAPKKSNEVDSG